MESEVIRFNPNKSAPESVVEGNLVVPDDPIGIVIFAHGSGSSKKSQRNELISKMLNEHNIGTLLFDLLSREEQESDKQLENIQSSVPGAKYNKFNIALLSERLSLATELVLKHAKQKHLSISYFGSSTGAAAAIVAAARFRVSSIVARSGRTDLVENKFLPQISACCLFIVGGKEKNTIKINQQTVKRLKNAPEKKIIVIPNASHMFEEEGSLENVANIAAEWFEKHFEVSVPSLS